VRMVRDAIEDSEVLSARRVEVFAQGSYRNNTEVRVESDVDICVMTDGTIFFDLPDGVSREDVGLLPPTLDYSTFKAEVGAALVAKFGRAGVTRGNKASDVHENGYRVDADVVACFEHRRYEPAPAGGYQYIAGTEFRGDDGAGWVNWPEQHYENGVRKNRATGNRFKYMVRALKRLRHEMDDRDVRAAAGIPSYLIECLVWNVPDEFFGDEEYVVDIATSWDSRTPTPKMTTVPESGGRSTN
jgi:hypothetical protein